MKSLLATFGVVSVLLAVTAGRYGPMAQVTKDPLGAAALAVVIVAATAHGASSDPPADPEAVSVSAKVAAVAMMKLLDKGEQRPRETASR
jgi:hypothetical protein